MIKFVLKPIKYSLLFVLSFIFVSEANSQTVIQLEKSVRGVYIIPCKVNGLNLKFIFDTGASSVIISESKVRDLLEKGYLTETDLFGISSLQIANGETVEGSLLKIRYLEIGGHKFQNVQAKIIQGEDVFLLLGQSAIERLGKFQIDYSNNTLLLFDDKLVLEAGTLYGCISGNCINGQGTYTFQNGDIYVGEFKDEKINGLGTCTFQNGDKYVGYFKDGLFHGNGKLFINDGSIYDGDFKNGKYSGKGTYTFPDGAKYNGYFLDYQFNGLGTLTSPNGQVYEGAFKNDKYNGYGVLSFPSGQKYEGNFKNDKYNGQGSLTLSNGEKQIGLFKDGKFIGE